MMDQKSFRQQQHAVQIIRIATSVMAGLLMAIAILAIWRRHAGAFQTPLSVMMFLFVGLTVIGPAAILRNWWRLVTRSKNVLPVEVAWTLCTPTLSLLAILVAISVPGTSMVGVVLLGVFFIAGEAMVYRPRKRSACAEPAMAISGSIVGGESDDEGHHLEASLDSVEPDAESTSHFAANLSYDTKAQPEKDVSQQLVRCRTEDGRDCLKGWLRVDIPAGHRAQSVHLAFCPAFTQPPKIEVHSEGTAPASRIKTVQCLSYGVHLEIKLPHPSLTDETLTLRFQAVGENE